MKAKAPIRRFAAMKELVGACVCACIMYMYSMYEIVRGAMCDTVIDISKHHSMLISSFPKRISVVLLNNLMLLIVSVCCAGTVDALMDAMKVQCPSLSGVYERSDAMLAVYPGEGARFAKHIDNSTGMPFHSLCACVNDFSRPSTSVGLVCWCLIH